MFGLRKGEWCNLGGKNQLHFFHAFPFELQGFPRCPSDQFNNVVTRTMGIFDVEEVGTISFRELLTTFALAMSGVSVK